MEPEHQIRYNGFTCNGNYLWGGALILAWKELIDKFTQQHVQISSDNKQVQKVVRNFNICQFSHKDIQNKSIYVKSGYGQATVNIINQESKKKFPQKTFSQLKCQLSSSDIICYAYLFKSLWFKIKFSTQKGRKFLFQGKQTDSFFAKDKKQKQQIFWHYYLSKDQFMISIQSKNPKDRIYFVKDHTMKTIDQAFNKIGVQQGKDSYKLDQADFFQMPKVELDVKRNVQELIGIKIINKKLAGYQFSIVYEAIKLKIDQAGAKVQNQAVMTLCKKKAVLKKAEPKYFILDKQFWVVMKESGHHPYFGALIRNPLGL